MQFYIKPEKDLDFYVEWSSVVDSPTSWGPANTQFISKDRKHRCDTTGTSLKDGEYGWNDDERTIIVHELGTAGDFWLLPLDKMVEFFSILGDNPADPLLQDMALNACATTINTDD